jgi:hypothetical protein
MRTILVLVVAGMLLYDPWAAIAAILTGAIVALLEGRSND